MARSDAHDGDVVVAGGGHNGVTAAAYLVRAGRRVVVLERRHVVGGAAVTEELFPGFKYSVASYVVSLLRPEIIRDLELQRHGLEILPLESTFTPLPDGDYLMRWADHDLTRREIARHSPHDAEAYDEFGQLMLQMARAVKPILGMVPPDPGSLHPRELLRLGSLGRHMRNLGEKNLYALVKLLTMSAYDYLSRWFESEDAKLVLGFFAGGGGANSSLKTPGSAYMLARGIVRDGNTPAGPAGFMKGGMSTISEAIRRSGEAYGMEVHTGVPVERILVDDGRAVGIRLAGGEEICSKIVVANATARTVFTKLIEPSLLPEDFNRDIRNIRCESTVFRVNLVLKSLPDAPVFAQAAREDGVLSQMTIAPSVAYMERAHRIAQEGEIAAEPFLIVKVPSTVDPTLAPP